MIDFFNMNKRNKGIILSYVLILSSVLIGYLFMLVLRVDGYQPEIYKYGYMYFMIFSFLLFSIMIPLWEVSGEKLKDYMKMFIEVIVFSISSIPLILIIFIVGRINVQYILLPIFIQTIWGMVILSIKNIIKITNINQIWKALLLNIFVFLVLILNMIFLYFYSQYANLVITTVYDKDILTIFFLNPLLSLTGTLYTQIGGTNQMGSMPINLCLIFWVVVIFISGYLTNKISKRQEV